MKFITINNQDANNDQETVFNLEAIVILQHTTVKLTATPNKHYYYIRTIEGTNHSINEQQYQTLKNIIQNQNTDNLTQIAHEAIKLRKFLTSDPKYDTLVQLIDTQPKP